MYGVAWPRDGFGAPNLPRNKTHSCTIAARQNYIASPPTLRLIKVRPALIVLIADLVAYGPASEPSEPPTDPKEQVLRFRLRSERVDGVQSLFAISCSPQPAYHIVAI